MTTTFELVDPPELVRIEHHTIEDILGNHHSHPFVQFRWHDADYWVLGKMRWHNIMAAGDVLLRLPQGRKTYRATMTVHPRSEPAAFSVSAPRKQQGALRNGGFVFVGFHPQKVMNIEFVRQEHRRLEWPYTGAIGKMTRPPAGHVV
jgi:hypothetical protein